MLFAALAFLGCGQDETTKSGDSKNAESPVYFLAATNDAFATRGTVITGNELDTDTQFRIYATQQTRQGETPTGIPTAFIPAAGDATADYAVSYGQVNVYDNNPSITPYYVNVWKTGKTYLWPDDVYMVNFYAVHPANAPIITDITASKSIVFDGSTDDLSLKGQYDLMYATARRHKEDSQFTAILDGFNDKSTVALNFTHVLSRIAFYGMLSEELKGYGWKVQIQDISICNVNVAGTLTFNDDPTASPAATLTPAATSTKSSVTLAMNTASHLTLTTTAVEQDEAGQNVPLTSPTDVAMLMPQTLAAWTPATENTGTTVPATNGGYLKINMRIVDGDGHYHLGSAGDNGYEPVFQPFKIDWAASKAYRYTLTFGLGLNAAGVDKKQPITIECAIQPWISTAVSGTAEHH